MDLYSRRIVGWSMSNTMHAKMVADALLMALWRRGRPAELIRHSDQGSLDRTAGNDGLLPGTDDQCQKVGMR
ncbi:hypothetical protein WS68_12270 [Burkholderia sp. TSV86]|nr:hypothetical protein WS68_12270 [Burkholderia sp. TSV86]